jgi:hypothetical protein
MKWFRVFGWLVALSWAAGSLPAQTSYPMLMSLKPVAVQVGQASEHVLKSRYSMHETFDVLVTGSGVRGEVVAADGKPGEKPNLQEIKIRFSVAADAQPGVRDFRIATPRGASTVGQLVVVRQPVIQENASNDSQVQAQAIPVPSALCGAVERNEDVDFFKFHVEAGQSLSFQARSMRLQDRIHDLQNHVDPILTIRNAQGATIAANDNYFYGDPFIHQRFETAGDYFLEIRDVRFKGNQYWEYCIEITSEPFVTSVFPPAVARGQAAMLQLAGYQLPANASAVVRVADNQSCGVADWLLPMGSGTTNPVPLAVTDEPVYFEQSGDNNVPQRSQYLSLPGQLAGRIESESDVDCFTFAALKGESFSFEVIARRQASALDSHLRVLDERGRQLAVNDDLRLGRRTSSDSLIESWSAPADGLYALEIRDLHGRGGLDFVYAIQARRAQPGFRLWLDTDKTQLTPGTSSVLFVRCERQSGFAGEIQLHIGGLPHAVTASCGRILTKGQDGCIVLEADPDAPWGATNVSVTGTATHPLPGGQSLPLAASALTYQEIYQPGGGRGHWPVDMHTVCVGDRGDIWSVRLSDYDVTLKPGESRTIGVTIDRAPGFDKNVMLEVTYNHLNTVYGDSLPPGVKLDLKTSKTLLTGLNSEGAITLTAAKDAQPAERQQVAVMGNVSINFVMKATYASRPLWVSVAGGEATR